MRWRVDAAPKAQTATGSARCSRSWKPAKARRSGSDDETQPLQEARAVAASLVYLGDGVRPAQARLGETLASSVDTEA